MKLSVHIASGPQLVTDNNLRSSSLSCSQFISDGNIRISILQLLHLLATSPNFVCTRAAETHACKDQSYETAFMFGATLY